MAANTLQTVPSFYTKISEKASLFLQIHTKNTMFVQTTASRITTIRRVSNPLVNVILYYLETLKSSWRIWIHFVSPIITWTVCIHYPSIDSVEKLLQRVDKRLITCNEQLTLITETRELTEYRALQKIDSWGKISKSISSAPFKRQKQCKPVAQCLQKQPKRLKRLNFNWIK